MKITKTKFEGLVVIEFERYSDDRGEFMELYNAKDHNVLLNEERTFKQDNYSISKKGVFRGLHLQVPPFAQAKLVQVLSGKVTDIVFDLRTRSQTYGKAYSIELSGSDNKQLFIPRGFAHGFLSHEDNTCFHYKCDNFYSKGHEETILWDSDNFEIELPIKDLIISKKDQEGQPFIDFVSPF